jgi:hypothetical protein
MRQTSSPGMLFKKADPIFKSPLGKAIKKSIFDGLNAEKKIHF